MALVAYPYPDCLFIQSNRPEITPIVYSSTAGLNLWDVILPYHVEVGLPAQSVVENADCRLFYTRYDFGCYEHMERWHHSSFPRWTCVNGS